MPVDVIGQDELQKRGSPSTIDLIKSLPISGPVLGDSNQFSTAAQGQVGAGTINLRGLGSLRTLVLLNGRRTTASPGAGSGGVDTNLLPVAAVGRVEVLKDGAAATYGSDAISGVVNFITRRNFSGLEVAADYRAVEGSSGDYTTSAVYGWVGDMGNILLSAGYQHRSELRSTDRDWANQPYLTNPAGYSVLGQPGSFLPRNAANSPTAGVQRDANCSAVGGFAGFSGATPACYFTYVPFDNLIEEENRFQLYAEANVEFSENLKFHAEGHYAKTDIPHILFSPSYPPTSVPNGPGSVGVFTVPISNPGAQTALQQAGLSPAAIAATNNISLTLFRALGAGGNPAEDYGGQRGSRTYDIFRVSAGLSGEFSGIGWDTAVTDSDATSDQRPPTRSMRNSPSATRTTAAIRAPPPTRLTMKWQLTDSFALRGSVGTTFRGPTPTNRSSNQVTGLSGIIAAGNNFKSVDFPGNPAIGPEKAFTYNIGAIFETGGFRAIVDYWSFKIEDQITSVPANVVATAVAGVGKARRRSTAPVPCAV